MRKMTLGPQDLGLASDHFAVLLGRLFPYPPPKGHLGQSLSLGSSGPQYLHLCSQPVVGWVLS